MEEETMFYKNIGLRIANLREKKGMTQEKLGQHVDLSRVSIVNIEKGRQKPSLYLLYKMAEVFGISLIFFFDYKAGINDFGIKSSQENITNRDIDDLASFMKDSTIKP